MPSDTRLALGRIAGAESVCRGEGLGKASEDPRKTAGATEHFVTKLRFKLVEFLLANLAMSVLVEVHPNFSPD
jgi:hypothetical protein